MQMMLYVKVSSMVYIICLARMLFYFQHNKNSQKIICHIITAILIIFHNRYTFVMYKKDFRYYFTMKLLKEINLIYMCYKATTWCLKNIVNIAAIFNPLRTNDIYIPQKRFRILVYLHL